MAYPSKGTPFDNLTSTDERIDFVHKQLIDVILGVNKLLDRIGEPALTVITKYANLRQAVPPLTGVRVFTPSPLTGRILQLIPHFPDGCNGLVDLAVGHKDTWLLPSETDTFIALNNATPVLTIDEPIEKGEEIWMIVNNGDVFLHTISVAITIIGVE